MAPDETWVTLLYDVTEVRLSHSAPDETWVTLLYDVTEVRLSHRGPRRDLGHTAL